MEFPKDFEKCPICGHKDTVARLALADEPPILGLGFPAMKKEITPIQDFMTISTPTTKVITRHYDLCAKCGFEYCTRVEKMAIPTNLLMQMMGIAFQMPKAR